MVIKLSAFMRYSLDSANQKISTLEKELHHIDLYLEIEKVRFGDMLHLEKNIDPSTSNWQMPAMILQPLLENAVKYGLYESTEPITITLDIFRENGILKIRVVNPYNEHALKHKGTGTGLKNIELRMQYLYKRNDLTKIIKSDNYFLVELKVPEHAKPD
jgi:LytS/YehU family sensor histidine kinase